MSSLQPFAVSNLELAKVKQRLENASNLIKTWSRQNFELQMPKQWRLTKTRLGLKGGKFVHLTGKAWHCKIVLGFLVSFLETQDVDPMLKTACWAAENFLGVLSESRQDSIFLQPQEIQQVQTVGMLFVDCYLRLRLKFENWCLYKLFNVRPKLHLLCHFLGDCTRIRNPLTASTYMDEDWLRRVMKLARKTHIKTTQSSTLKRYLAGPAPALSLSAGVACCIHAAWIAGLQFVIRSGPQQRSGTLKC